MPQLIRNKKFCRLHRHFTCHACPSRGVCKLCTKLQLAASKNCAACMVTKPKPLKRGPLQHVRRRIAAYVYQMTAIQQKNNACARHANDITNCRLCILATRLRASDVFTYCNKHKMRMVGCGLCFRKKYNCRKLRPEIMQKTKPKNVAHNFSWQNLGAARAVAAVHDG